MSIYRFSQIFIFVLLISLFSVINISSQEKTDFNQFYKFPLSIGVDFNELAPLEDYGFDSTLTEISGNLRYPLPGMPQIQPMFQFGVLTFDDLNRDEPDKWDHRHYFASLGALY